MWGYGAFCSRLRLRIQVPYRTRTSTSMNIILNGDDATRHDTARRTIKIKFVYSFYREYSLLSHETNRMMVGIGVGAEDIKLLVGKFLHNFSS